MAYIHDLRQKVGHTPLIMTSASGALVEDGRILLQERADTGDWAFPAATWSTAIPSSKPSCGSF
jgi:hypothetical protein